MLSEALSLEFDAVGVVDEAIEDCVGNGRISDNFVPAIDGQLASDDDRASFISVLDDLEQIAALIGVERLRSPIIICGRPQMASTFSTLLTTWSAAVICPAYWCGANVRGP